MKAKTVFFCTECGSESPKWSGRCTVCGAWNSMVEQAAERPSKGGKISRPKTPVKVSRITEMQTDEEIRFSTGMGELDRVLGGGAVKGSLVLVGGAPGIGKSTLMLQICQQLGQFAKVLYVSGEESTRQLKLRAERLHVDSETCSCCRKPGWEMCWNAWPRSSRTFSSWTLSRRCTTRSWIPPPAAWDR